MNETEDDEVEAITEERVCELLRAGLEEIAEDEGLERIRVRTFSDAGILTSNVGLVVRIGDQEWQVEVIRSR